MKKKSFWLDTVEIPELPSLEENINTDVLIIGGGLTGISAAYHLIGSGLKVVLVEQNRIGHGVTARTTGKLTYLQETIYQNLVKNHSCAVAKKYYESQVTAIKMVKDIIEKHHIDCDFEEVVSYIYTMKENEQRKIDAEKRILEQFGAAVTLEKMLPSKLKCYALKAEHTAVFHPLKYMKALLELLIKEDISVYEHTPVQKIEKLYQYYFCHTKTGIIKAKYVIVATHYPYFLLPYLFPLRASVEKSYLGVERVSKTYPFSAITIGNEVTSFRYAVDEDKKYRISLYGSYPLYFKLDSEKNFSLVKKQLSKKGISFWSNNDVMTSDSLPLIGPFRKSDSHFLVGTGYNTWGMTNANLAGNLLADYILGKKNPYASLFVPYRKFHFTILKQLPFVAFGTLKSYLQSKIGKKKAWYPESVVFFKKDGKQLATYTDSNGKKHTVYNHCPHMGCSLLFNETELTWDCPCHASRFDIDGTCIEGPSNASIRYKDDGHKK